MNFTFCILRDRLFLNDVHFFFRFNWCYPYSLHVPLRPCSAIEMFNFFSFSYILMGSAVFFQMIVYYGFDFFNEIN